MEQPGLNKKGLDLMTQGLDLTTQEKIEVYVWRKKSNVRLFYTLKGEEIQILLIVFLEKLPNKLTSHHFKAFAANNFIETKEQNHIAVNKTIHFQNLEIIFVKMPQRIWPVKSERNSFLKCKKDFQFHSHNQCLKSLKTSFFKQPVWYNATNSCILFCCQVCQ